ncbi:uncharacterized protein DUF4907 [Chitinophaga skermanii]|uniref:Uncharacterized protein DUF4907 n=1 Tax=Chitinophaga skermanii TaxID=331697 RepID=A0A327R2I8_9BACT|nr:DUF4907 domain-containing protein [Chitinophaga skermanii]RAJ10890.1 uncharacterized protein DUF4907 [Chitinophaga skermanii]
MKQIFRASLFMGWIVVLESCNPSPERSQPSINQGPEVLDAPVQRFTFEVFKNADGTYGFDILENNKVMMHQHKIPNSKDTLGFSTSEEARSVASYYVMKLGKKQQPEIHPKTLDSLIERY